MGPSSLCKFTVQIIEPIRLHASKCYHIQWPLGSNLNSIILMSIIPDASYSLKYFSSDHLSTHNVHLQPLNVKFKLHCL